MVAPEHVRGMDAGVVRVAGVPLLDTEQEPATEEVLVMTVLQGRQTVQHAQRSVGPSLAGSQWSFNLQHLPNGRPSQIGSPASLPTTHLASLVSLRWNLLISPIFFIRWKAMQESGFPTLTASRWKESYCQLSTLARALASYERGGPTVVRMRGSD